MAKLTLYFTPGSPPSRAVLFLLRYLDIDVDVKILNLMKREQHSEEFLKLNPAHEVPTLIDGEFVLTESRAILAYLINTRKPGSDLYPTEPKARARVDQRLSYDHILFTKNGMLIRPVIFGGSSVTSQQAQDDLIETVKVIDALLANSKWIAGANLTIADFSAVATIATIVECGYNLEKHSNLARWYKQCKSLKGFDENLKGATGLATFIKSKVQGPVYKL